MLFRAFIAAIANLFRVGGIWSADAAGLNDANEIGIDFDLVTVSRRTQTHGLLQRSGPSTISPVRLGGSYLRSQRGDRSLCRIWMHSGRAEERLTILLTDILIRVFYWLVVAFMVTVISTALHREDSNTTKIRSTIYFQRLLLTLVLVTASR